MLRSWSVEYIKETGSRVMIKPRDYELLTEAVLI